MKATLILILLFFTIQTGATTGRGYILCSIKKDHVSKYINSIWDDAEWCSKKYKIPLALIIAQLSLESGYGRSFNARNLNNHLGIRPEGKYSSFASVRDCLDMYGRILTTGSCYMDFQPHNLQEWIEAVSYPCCTWATSRKYTKKINWIINKYNLNELKI